MIFPTEAQLRAANFEHDFMRYVHDLTAWGRVPQSREVILTELRASTLDSHAFLRKKRAMIKP